MASRLLFSAAVIVALSSVATGKASEPLTVELQSGRVFTASVDQRTDGERLWLRFGDSSMFLLRPVEWDAVVAAWRGDEPIPRNQLRTAAEALKSETPEEEHSAPQATESEPTRGYAYKPPPVIVPLPRVASVTFDVFLANWDADIEADGLIAVVRPLDAWGRMVPIDGVADVELFGAVRRTFHSVPHGRGVVEQSLDRWTNRLDHPAAGPEGYVLKLPFQANHPGADEAASRGRVHLRLTVPGHGVFEDVQHGVLIRPFAPK